MKNTVLFFLALVLVFTMQSCSMERGSGYDDEGNLYGRISISGAWAMYPLVVRWAEEFRKEHPAVRIDISAGGAGKGMADVLGNMVDIAMVSREITLVEEERGAWHMTVAKDAVIPTFNVKNPFRTKILEKGFHREQFQEIFLHAGRQSWESYLDVDGNTTMTVYTRSNACGAAEVWANYLGVSQEDIRGIGVFGDPGIADIVKNDPLGIGYNNIAFAYDINTRKPFPGLAVIPINIDGTETLKPEEKFYDTLDQLMEAIEKGLYPSPPARNLYLVSNGPPENVAAIAFLHWILEKGQMFVSEAGYVRIPESETDRHRQRLPVISKPS